MSRVVPLSDSKIKSLSPKEKDYKVADGDGLYLLVTPTGSKLWKMRYSLNGKSTTKALGKYPSVTLAGAREQRKKLRAKVANGTKPTTLEEEEKLNFKELCEKYFTHRKDLTAKYIKNNKSYLANHYYPTMEHLRIEEIEPFHVIEVVKFMNKQGIHETIRRTGSLLDRIFKYAVTLQYMRHNPMSEIDLSIIVGRQKRKNFAHITDEDALRELLLAIDDYSGDLHTKTALQLMPYVFLRPANIRGAKWEQIDFDKKVWVIPADEMKMERDHIIPLTDSMIRIIKRVDGNSSRLVFPSPLSRTRIMSENTLNVGLKRLGYKDAMTAHGFRHTASTMLHENIHKHGIPSDVIEMQLAHVEKNKVKGTYNKALYMKQRIELMKWWSSYLDFLKL